MEELGLSFFRKLYSYTWAPALAPPPLEFEKVTTYAAVLQNTLKFSLAPSALELDTLYFSLKRREKRKNFRLRLRRAVKWSIFRTARWKGVEFLKCRSFCPSLEKFLRAPMYVFYLFMLRCVENNNQITGVTVKLQEVTKYSIQSQASGKTRKKEVCNFGGN